MFDIRAGDLNTVIVIKSPTIGQDADGGMTKSYSNLATVWGKVQFGGGSRTTTTAQGGSEVQPRVRVTIRYLDTLTPECILTFGTKDYQILNIDNLYNANMHQIIDLRAKT